MLHGQDETILPCLAMGGVHKAASAGQPTTTAKKLTGILEAWAAGDLETARERGELLTGSDQRDLSLSRQYRGWQADHEADRARFR